MATPTPQTDPMEPRSMGAQSPYETRAGLRTLCRLTSGYLASCSHVACLDGNEADALVKREEWEAFSDALDRQERAKEEAAR